MMLEHPLLAASLVRALREGRPVSLTDTSAGGLYDVMLGLSMLIVAADENDAVVGVLMSLPPVGILGQSMRAGVLPAHILFAAQAVAKLKGVAVDESARGRGIGTALINLCVQTYTQLGWQAVYGQFGKKTGLENYYPRLGFTVLGSNEGVRFGRVLTFPLVAHPLDGERMFVRWLTDDAAAS